MDAQCRVAQKALLELSKHSKNFLSHKIYDLKNITDLLTSRRLNLLSQLFSKKTTSKYIMALLAKEDRSYSMVNDKVSIHN